MQKLPDGFEIRSGNLIVETERLEGVTSYDLVVALRPDTIGLFHDFLDAVRRQAYIDAQKAIAETFKL